MKTLLTSGGMATLYIDIETTPIKADVWDLWNQNIGLNQINEPTRMLCFAAKWAEQRKPLFYSEWQHGSDEMIEAAWSLLDLADVIVHYNGERFDTPHLNREFLAARMGPPAPYQQVDLYRVVKRRFKFPSNKLDYVLGALGYPGKVKHEGHSLWTRCLAGDERAQKLMERYNIRDAVALQPLHERLLPWIPGAPSAAAYSGNPDACPFCGSAKRQRRGFAYTGQSRYQRYQCQNCKGWYRDVRRTEGANVRPVAV